MVGLFWLTWFVIGLYLHYKWIKYEEERHQQQIKYEVPDVIPERKAATLEA